MAKVSTRTPPLISLYFCQESGDPDYGSCLWAVFNFDLERYELSITSDCGNYAYGWVPTHKSESFMHLMARLDSGYLLDKLASPCVINEEATFEAVKELMEALGVDFSETDRWGDPVFDMDEIKDSCYQSNEAMSTMPWSESSRARLWRPVTTMISGAVFKKTSHQR